MELDVDFLRGAAFKGHKAASGAVVLKLAQRVLLYPVYAAFWREVGFPAPLVAGICAAYVFYVGILLHRVLACGLLSLVLSQDAVWQAGSPTAFELLQALVLFVFFCWLYARMNAVRFKDVLMQQHRAPANAQLSPVAACRGRERALSEDSEDETEVDDDEEEAAEEDHGPPGSLLFRGVARPTSASGERAPALTDPRGLMRDSPRPQAPP